MKAAAGGAALLIVCPRWAAASEPSTAPAMLQRYKIAASDWMLLKRQKPGALQLCKDCGLDGVEVDMGPLGKRPTFENNLREDDFRNQYLEQAKNLGLEISSLAMSAFYGQPIADHPKAEDFATEWIDLMGKMGTKVGFVPVIAKEGTEKVVELFKRVGPQAKKANVLIGLNTQLDAEANKKLLDDIGSPAIRIAYNIGEATDANRDVYKELHDLGRDRIAQIIPTLSDGKWLQDDERIDVPKLKNVLDNMNWSGWLVLQRSRMKGKSVKENFAANAKYLKSVFQAG
jgi:sugar phosphate isomerase/epimerase